MKYLITGATGFMGPHLIKRLSEEGHNCRCLVRSKEKAEQLLKYDNVEIVEGNITKPETLKGVCEGVDRLVHMAAALGHSPGGKIPLELFEKVNVNGTINIMEEALIAGVSKIVHCSTVAAMGICGNIIADEKTPCNPHNEYGKSKLKAEEIVRSMTSDNGLSALILRFTIVYGPGDPRDILKLTRIAKKGIIPQIGNRPKLTPLLHLYDAVEAIILASEKGRIGETYLITNDRSEKFDDIMQMILKGLNIYRPVIYIPEEIAMGTAFLIEKLFMLFGKNPPVTKKNIESTLADRIFSINKAKTELGFTPQIDPQYGLGETVKWYINNGWV